MDLNKKECNSDTDVNKNKYDLMNIFEICLFGLVCPIFLLLDLRKENKDDDK